LELRAWFSVVRTHAVLVVGGVALAVIVALVVSLALPKSYESRVTLVVGQSLTSVNPEYNQLLASQRLSQTYAALATTRSILERVIRDLGLDMDHRTLESRTTVDLPKDSTLLSITVLDGDPGRAADIANAIAEELIAISPTVQGQRPDASAGDAERRALQARIQGLQAQIDVLDRNPARTPAEQAELERLQASIVTLWSSYWTLLGDGSNPAANYLAVVDPAFAPDDPASPRIVLNVLLAAIIGLLAALAQVFALERLDEKIRSAEHVAEATGASTLSAIPRRPGEDFRNPLYSMVTLTHPRSASAERFRALRTNLEYATPDDAIRTLLVTSALKGEGKTTVAGNLAVVFAQAGRTTLLVDADLRSPSVHGLFRLSNAAGLTTLLRSRQGTPVEQVIQPTEEPNLSVITSGPVPPNPAELLASHRMRSLIEQLAGLAEIVVIDSPPVLAVTDPVILSVHVDGTLFVTRAGKTRRQVAKRGVDTLRSVDARVLGVVLNSLPEREAEIYPYDDEETAAAPALDPRKVAARGSDA
jgi:polysaccharide biosynthesis transport protein